MAIYYKFKSAKDYDSISIDSHFISVASLKYKIFEKNRMSRGRDFDLVVTNAQTNEEYLEGMLIPKSTAVLVRRIPGLPRMPIIITPVADQEKSRLEAETKLEDVQDTKSSSDADSSVSKYLDDSEWDEFGDDLYAIPKAVPVQSSKPVEDAPLPSKADKDNKLKALINTLAYWQSQDADSSGAARGFDRWRSGGRDFGRGGLLERTTPPQGYVCHRCKVPGHFIQHCPTNGDPAFDIKQVKPSTGIPNSLLMATPDGSYALPSGEVAVLKPNGAAFEKEMEGTPSTRSAGDLPPELYCPLCSAVMKDAVFTSKCCFKSFCDKCIRDYVISKLMCVCGARNALAGDLLPNKTLRDTIIRILERSNSSGNNGRSVLQPQDMESAQCLQPKMLSPNITSPPLSAASKGDVPPHKPSEGGVVPPHKPSEGDVAPPQNEETTKIQEMTEPDKVTNATKKPLDIVKVEKGALISEPTHESGNVKEPVSQISSQVANEEGEQKPVSGEVGKKKKKKIARLPSEDMQWNNPQDFGAENYLPPVEPAYIPYWNSTQPGFDGFGAPYAHPMLYSRYGPEGGPMPFGVGFPQDLFGAQGYMFPFLAQRDLAGFVMGFNGMGFSGAPSIMSSEEFKAEKAAIKNKRDLERTGESREISRDGGCGREMRGHGDVPSMNLISKSIPLPPDNLPHRPQSERPLPNCHTDDREILRMSSKRKSIYNDAYHKEHHSQHREKERSHHLSEPSSAVRPPIPPKTSDSNPSTDKTFSDKKLKAGVFAPITFSSGESAPSKKQKLRSSSPSAINGSRCHSNHSHSHRESSTGYHENHHRSADVALSRNNSYSYVDDYNYESSDEDRHFKRRPSRYDSSSPALAREEAPHSSRGLRGKYRGHSSSKHRQIVDV